MTIEIPDAEADGWRLTPETSRVQLAVGLCVSRQVSLRHAGKIAKSLFSFSCSLLVFVSAQAQVNQPRETAVDRFLRYVKIDTQSQEDQTSVPSTRKQLVLAKLLV